MTELKTLKEIITYVEGAENNRWTVQQSSKTYNQLLREEAKKWLRDILSGCHIFDRNLVPESMKGEIAKDKWNTSADFSYGMENGAIAFILEFFNLEEEELKEFFNLEEELKK